MTRSIRLGETNHIIRISYTKLLNITSKATLKNYDYWIIFICNPGKPLQKMMDIIEKWRNWPGLMTALFTRRLTHVAGCRYIWHQRTNTYLCFFGNIICRHQCPNMASNTAKSSSIFRNRVSARKLYCSGTLQIPHGTLDLPSVHFDGNVHTGFYMESDGAIGF